MTYHHTQRGPLFIFVLLAAAVVGVGAGVLLAGGSPLGWVLVGVAVVVLLLAACMRHLTISDEDSHLAVRFGPLPLFARRIAYDQITAAMRGRTTWLDGWGIHWSLSGGWVWNIWGFDCVIIHMGRRRLKLGTDDPEGLVALLAAKAAGTA